MKRLRHLAPYLALAALAAGCKREVPGEEDAGVPPVEDAGVRYLDGRKARGPDLTAQSFRVSTDTALFAAGPENVALRSACAGSACEYRWAALDGGTLAEGHGYLPIFSTTPASPDGRQLLLLAQRDAGTCDHAGTPREVVSGDLLLLDAATGAVRSRLPDFTTHRWGETPFTSGGGYFRTLAQTPGECGSAVEALRHTRAPFSVAPAQKPDVYVEHELPDGRWVGSKDGQVLAVMNPDDPSAFETIAPEMQSFTLRDGDIHAFSGVPTRAVDVRLASGERLHWDLSPEEEWYPAGASGRWVALYGRLTPTTYARPLKVHDLRGEHPDRALVIPGTTPARQVFLAGRANVLVLHTFDAAGAPMLAWVDLTTGVQERLFSGTPSGGLPEDALVLGDDRAVVAFDARQVVLVGARGVEPLVKGTIAAVYGVGTPRSTLELPQRQLAFIVRRRALGVFALDVLSLAQRTLITLSDDIEWSPELNGTAAQESCGRPWVTRAAGDAFQSLANPAHHLFFVERRGTASSLLLMPVDLSSPPQRLATMVPAYCHAPLVEPDGRRAAVMLDGYDTAAFVEIRSAALP